MSPSQYRSKRFIVEFDVVATASAGYGISVDQLHSASDLDPAFGDRPSGLKRADVTHPEHRPSGSMSFRHIDGKGASVVSSWHLAAQITPPDHPQREHFGRQWCHRCRTSQSVRPNPSGFIIPRWWVSIPVKCDALPVVRDSRVDQTRWLRITSDQT
jgi:hypothetical protein